MLLLSVAHQLRQRLLLSPRVPHHWASSLLGLLSLSYAQSRPLCAPRGPLVVAAAGARTGAAERQRAPLPTLSHAGLTPGCPPHPHPPHPTPPHPPTHHHHHCWRRSHHCDTSKEERSPKSPPPPGGEGVGLGGEGAHGAEVDHVAAQLRHHHPLHIAAAGAGGWRWSVCSV